MMKKAISVIIAALMLFTAAFGAVPTAYAAAKPVKVASFKATPACSKVTLKWKKQKNVTGYEIYVSTKKNGKYKKVKTVKTNKAVLKLKLGKTRYYKARAYVTVGKKKKYGAFSVIKKAKAAHQPSTSWTVKKAATCAEQGEKTNICKFCKKKFSVKTEKDLTTHKYVKELVTENPVYEDYTKYTCTVCGDTYTTKLKKHSFEPTVTAPSCTEQGYTTYKCSKCGFSYVDNYTAVIPHTFETKSVARNCTDWGYDIQVCTVCGYVDESSKVETEEPLGTAHVFEEKTVEPTCTEEGYTAMVCTVCGFIDEKTKVTTPALGHDFEEKYTVDENYFRVHNCTRCDEVMVDKTCYIDIESETVSNPNYASFKKSSTNTTEVNDKLDLSTNEDGTIDFEITGSRSNFTIDINAVGRTEVKLNGVTLENNGRDCINVKNRAPSYDENGELITDKDGAPVYGEAQKVFLSAKDMSENTLIANTSGNAIDSSCPLELRGHGKLNLRCYDTTAIDNKAKLTIKNLTLDIISGNRGIDTKDTVLVPGIGGALVEDEVYYNVEIEDNATIKIKSADDCIRCKNMTFLALEEGHTATVMNVESTMGDGIQLEGNKGFTALSGNITIKAKKYAFNCTEDLIVIDSAVTVNATGTAGYCKPA